MDDEVSNDRYRANEYVLGTQPNVFVRLEAADMEPGRALDLGCGDGRDAIWLASRGWDVTGVDFAREGLERAVRTAADRGVVASWHLADAAGWRSDRGFDLVVVCYLQVPADQRRAVMASAVAALAPGGVLLVVARDVTDPTAGLVGSVRADALYSSDDVVADLSRTGTELVVDLAERVERRVATESGTMKAVDCVVRARRTEPDDEGTS